MCQLVITVGISVITVGVLLIMMGVSVFTGDGIRL